MTKKVNCKQSQGKYTWFLSNAIRKNRDSQTLMNGKLETNNEHNVLQWAALAGTAVLMRTGRACCALSHQAAEDNFLSAVLK